MKCYICKKEKPLFNVRYEGTKTVDACNDCITKNKLKVIRGELNAED